MIRPPHELLCALVMAATSVTNSGAKTPVPNQVDLTGPWGKKDAAIVIDPYHENNYTIKDLKLDPKIVGIIHKATEGSNTTDPKYLERMKEAVAAKYLWGSFHIGRPGDPKGQADRYYTFVKPRPQDVIALDLEQDGGAMSMAEAAAFVDELHTLAHRYPILYGGRNTVDRPASAKDLAILKHCPLWLVSMRDKDPSYYHDAYLERWSDYTLWQFSSELRYRYPLKAAGKQPVDWRLDVNLVRGTPAQVRAAWPFSGDGR